MIQEGMHKGGVTGMLNRAHHAGNAVWKQLAESARAPDLEIMETSPSAHILGKKKQIQNRLSSKLLEGVGDMFILNTARRDLTFHLIASSKEELVENVERKGSWDRWISVPRLHEGSEEE